MGKQYRCRRRCRGLGGERERREGGEGSGDDGGDVGMGWDGLMDMDGEYNGNGGLSLSVPTQSSPRSLLFLHLQYSHRPNRLCNTPLTLHLSVSVFSVLSVNPPPLYSSTTNHARLKRCIRMLRTRWSRRWKGHSVRSLGRQVQLLSSVRYSSPIPFLPTLSLMIIFIILML